MPPPISARVICSSNFVLLPNNSAQLSPPTHFRSACDLLVTKVEFLDVHCDSYIGRKL